MSGPRILVVEDEFLIRQSLSEALAEAGFDVTEAETADEALPLLQDGQAFDLLVTDIRLPGQMDGCALAQAARNINPEIPVVFMTGRLPPKALMSPRDVYITKPYALDEVCRIARRMLGLTPA